MIEGQCRSDQLNRIKESAWNFLDNELQQCPFIVWLSSFLEGRIKRENFLILIRHAADRDIERMADYVCSYNVDQRSRNLPELARWQARMQLERIRTDMRLIYSLLSGQLFKPVPGMEKRKVLSING